MKKIVLIVLSLTYLMCGQVFAISSTDLQSLNTDSEYYWPGQCISSSSSTSTTLVGGDNEQQAFNFFVGKGLSAVQAAAVVGNLMDESSMDPTVLQKGGDSQNPNDAGTNPLDDGWGIAQWSPGGKIIGIAASLMITTPIYELSTQLNIVWDEMTGQSPTGVQDMIKTLESTTNLASAVTYFQVNFEGGVAGMRQVYAQQALSLYGSSVNNSGSSTSTATSSTSSSACNTTSTAVNCTAASSSTSSSSSTSTSSNPTSTLDPTRQSVVCIAEQELATWESQPDYATAHFPYAATGLLKYTQGWYEEWCADFVSWVYNQAGDPLQPDPNWMIPGVASIQSIGQEGKNFQWHPESSGYVPQPGDIAIHGSSHTNIFISSTGGVSTYIGGDQGDYGPYGADPPTTTPPNPPSESIVSIETGTGYYANGITGYVSPE